MARPSGSVGLVLVGVTLVALTGVAQGGVAYLNVGTDLDYSTGGNWSTSVVPGEGNNDEPWIGTNNTSSAIYSSPGSLTTSSRFVIGYGSGNGRLTMSGSAGTLTFGGDAYGSANYVAVDGGSGTLNINAGTMSLTAAGGAGVGGHLHVGANAGTSSGIVTIGGGALDVGTRITLGSGYNLAAGNGSGTLTINSGTVDIGTGTNADADKGFLYLTGSGGSGSATVNLNGGSLSLAKFNIGAATGAKTINLNGGTILARASRADFLGTGATVNVQNGGGIFNTNTFDITVGAALLNAGSGGLTKTGAGTLTLGGANTYTGNTTVSGGLLNVTGSLSGAPAGTQFYVNGGSLTFNNPAGTSTFYGNGYSTSPQIGEGATSGVLTVAAGTLNVLTQTGAGTSYGSLRLGCNSATANGTLIVNGGTLNVDGRILFAANSGTPAQGTLTIAGGQVNLGIPGSYTTATDPSCGVLWFGAGTSTVNLNSGTLAMFGTKSNTPAAGSTFNFNGGTLKAVANNNSDFMTAASLGANMTAVVKSGGAIIDDGGFAITISKALTHDSGLGATPDGGLTKLGSGTLTLSAINTYTGGTTVNGGVLVLNNGGPTGAIRGPLTVASGAEVQSAAGWALGYNTPPNMVTSITLNGGTLNFTTVYGGYGGDTINMTGGTIKTSNGATGFDVYAGVSNYANPQTTTINVFGDSTSLISANMNLRLQPTGGVVFNVAEGAAADDLIVSGVISQSGGGNVTKTGLGTLTLSANNTYTGSTTVEAGTLKLSGINSYTGGTTVNGGTLYLGTGGPTGVIRGNLAINSGGTVNASTTSWSLGYTSGNCVSAININGGTLTFRDANANGGTSASSITMTGGTINGSQFDWYNGITSTPTLATNASGVSSVLSGGINLRLGAGNALTFNVADGAATDDLLISGPIISTAGGDITKTGAGTLTLSGNNTYTGATTVSNGQLILFNASAYRSPTTVNAGAKLSWSGNTNMGNGNTAATIALNSGGTLENLNPASWTVINGAVTASGTTTINQTSNATGVAGEGFYLDGGLKGTGTVTINAANAGSGVNFRNNNTTFSGTLIVNGIASTTAFAGSGIGVGGCTTGLQNADITLNGTMELLNQGIGWANGAPGDFWMGALNGTGVMVANFTSGGQTRVRIGNTNNNGTFSGVIADGTGDQLVLTKNGTGTQTLSGANTYSGGTTVDGGILRLNYVSGPNGTIKGALTINSGAEVQPGNGWTLGYDSSSNYVSSITINGGTLNFVGGFGGTNAQTINLTGGTIKGAATQVDYYNNVTASGDIAFNTYAGASTATVSAPMNLRMNNNAAGDTSKITFTVADDAAATDLLVSGAISGMVVGQGLVKAGPGTMTLTGANSYAGATTVNNGTLLVNNPSGSGTGTGAVTVNGGVLGGTGTISGVVSVDAGILAPGVGPGILNTGSVTFAGPSSIFQVELNGTSLSPVPQYDQLNVTGSVTLNNATLDVALGYLPVYLDTFVIINNNDADPVTGIFAGLTEGTGFYEVYSSTPYLLQISYAGGTGNDVVLKVVPEPATLVLLGLGVLALVRRRRA